MLHFRSIKQLTAHDKVALAGAVAMGAGTFLPIVKFPIVGSINYLAGGHGDGVTVLLVAGVIVVAVFTGYCRTAAALGLAALLLTCFTLFRILEEMNELYVATKGNSFALLLANGVGLELGWLPLIGGALAVLAGGFTSPRQVSDASSTPFSSPLSGLDEAWASGMAQKINQRIEEMSRQKSSAPSDVQPPAQRAFGKRLRV
jgi:hypothetical protein